MRVFLTLCAVIASAAALAACGSGDTAPPSPSPTTTSASPTATQTSSTPTPDPTSSSASPTPTQTSSSASSWACTAPLGSGCPLNGGYVYAGIPNSNGYNTYLANQDVGANTSTTETMNANNPGDWQVVANAQPYGYLGVQTFPDVQQLMNNWPWLNGADCAASCKDTPVASLSTLKVNYSERAPQDANSIYEYAPDVWQDNYSNDVMFWVDTHGRCNEGAFGSTLLGHATIDGQNWTVHRYGGSGAEIIFVLDGAGGSGTCANQTAGSINIKAGLEWLVANGFETGPPVIGQLNTGYEITSADNTTFTVSSYSITTS